MNELGFILMSFICQYNCCNVLLCSFSYDGRWKQKLQTSVDFPLENLDLSQYVIGPKNNLKKYNLFSVSVSISLNYFFFQSKLKKKQVSGCSLPHRKVGITLKLWNYWHILNNSIWIDFYLVLYRITTVGWMVATTLPIVKMQQDSGGLNLTITRFLIFPFLQWNLQQLISSFIRHWDHE